MSYKPCAGEKCAAILPVAQDFLDRVEGAEDLLSDRAAECFVKLCAEHGLHPVEQKLKWRGTVAEARLNGFADAVAQLLPDDLSVFVYTAYAAEVVRA